MAVVGVGLEAWCVVWCGDHDGDGSGGDTLKMVEQWHGGCAMSLLLLYAYKSSLLTTRNKNKKEKNYLRHCQCLLPVGIPCRMVCPLHHPFLSNMLVVETVVVTRCVGVVRMNIMKCSSWTYIFSNWCNWCASMIKSCDWSMHIPRTYIRYNKL